MNGIGSQVNEFNSTMERIRNKQLLIKENAVKLNVMKGLKEIQSALTTISFLDVLASIDVNNPVIKKVQDFETMLSDLRKSIEDFVAENHFDSAEDASLNPEENMIPIPGVNPEDEEAKKKEEEEKEKSKISVSGVKDDDSDKSDDEEEKKDKEINKKKLEKSKN